MERQGEKEGKKKSIISEKGSMGVCFDLYVHA